ncbi:Arc family DNA-binding protein [Phyllobacterium sp. 22552]|uniref:Arc family DNA-binding protein n=1 Tax=Phyllobacterium sp. 22552 TaxID=3453941 RepID=UPI003F876D92
MAREDLHFRLRIPEELKHQVQAAASLSHRSMTAEIVSRLESTFDDPKLPLIRALSELQEELLLDEATDVDLPPIVYERLKQEADRRGLTVQKLMRRLIAGAMFHLDEDTSVGKELRNRIKKMLDEDTPF